MLNFELLEHMTDNRQLGAVLPFMVTISAHNQSFCKWWFICKRL